MKNSPQFLAQRPCQLPCDGLSDKFAHVARGRCAAEVAGFYSAGCARFACSEYRVVCSFVAEPLEHHRAAPNLADGVGDAFPRDVRCAAVHWLEQARKFTLRVDVCARRDTDSAGACRTQVRENVTEQIARDDHIKKRWALHEMCAQNIDVEFILRQLGIFLRHLNNALVPIRHRD